MSSTLTDFEQEVIRIYEADMLRAYMDGVRAYAWWKDGIQYVGTTGKTLEQALVTAQQSYRYHHRKQTVVPTITIREQLAAYAHNAWSGWMVYLFSKLERGTDAEGNVSMYVIPKASVQRWQRQMTTDYGNLPESEKQSDRDEADKMLAIMDIDNTQLRLAVHLVLDLDADGVIALPPDTLEQLQKLVPDEDQA